MRSGARCAALYSFVRLIGALGCVPESVEKREAPTRSVSGERCSEKESAVSRVVERF